MSHERTNSASVSDQSVYLILRDELKWRNVFRLAPGQVTTIGRAPTNRVVVPDDICSRHHCEIYQADGEWILKDLGSRNGTLVEGCRVTDDWSLSDGDQIQLGECYLVFTRDISRPSDGGEVVLDSGTETCDGSTPLSEATPEPEIVFRRHKTRYHSGGGSEAIGRDRASQELARMYRLALEMGSTRDIKELSEIVLDGLFSDGNVSIGAILLLPKNSIRPDPSQLRIAAYRTAGDESYEKVSNSLSTIVLNDWEAVLARDIKDDSRLTDKASLQQLQADSVICAPIRTKEAIYGLIHLYTTRGGRHLELDDLDYTLAVADQFAVALEHLQEKLSLQDGLAKARDEANTLRHQLAIESDLVGDSPAMEALKDTIARVAPTDATALIRGESGVGKELVARAIHFSSDRRGGPFVCMNCAALSETLLESELFGHEKGSFTGASGRKIGKFEQANRGTLFLDEVGEMSLPVQAKFLRVLEGHPFERVGGGSPITVDVRVVAATNRDLEQAIEEKKFRQDLFFRLFVMEIAVPALRDHASDIPVLAHYFLTRFSSRTSNRVDSFSEAAMHRLMEYNWPGNIRELQNTIERAVILARDSTIEPSDIQLSTRTSSAASRIATIEPVKVDTRDISLERLEREYILTTLERTSWNKSVASQILGIERSTLDRKLKRYKVSRPSRAGQDSV
ncbi:MAG: sigma 54-interacting transcriptional regulator [Planctomycetota bacterium]|nr:sigma 54-interacting transcriptional regulator [Planctomycetota bacterium]